MIKNYTRTMEFTVKIRNAEGVGILAVRVPANLYPNYACPIKGRPVGSAHVGAHVVEPDGSLHFIQTSFTRSVFPLRIFDCPLHQLTLGSRFTEGAHASDFLTHASNCTCFSKLATQYDFDKFCYSSLKTETQLWENMCVYRTLSQWTQYKRYLFICLSNVCAKGKVFPSVCIRHIIEYWNPLLYPSAL